MIFFVYSLGVLAGLSGILSFFLLPMREFLSVTILITLGLMSFSLFVSKRLVPYFMVKAKFMLDALPANTMVIDNQYSRGEISEELWEAKRNLLQTECNKSGKQEALMQIGFKILKLVPVVLLVLAEVRLSGLW